jgi:SRP19 protein
MYDAITKGLNLVATIENKAYSRDWLTPGRLRVQLKHADGTSVNPEVSTKAALLQQCAVFCSRHADRPRRLDEIKKFEAQLFGGGMPTPAASGKGGGLQRPQVVLQQQKQGQRATRRKARRSEAVTSLSGRMAHSAGHAVSKTPCCCREKQIRLLIISWFSLVP